MTTTGFLIARVPSCRYARTAMRRQPNPGCPDDSCRAALQKWFTVALTTDVHITTEPPIVNSRFGTVLATCTDHGTIYHLEPTGDQAATWAHEDHDEQDTP